MFLKFEIFILTKLNTVSEVKVQEMCVANRMGIQTNNAFTAVMRNNDGYLSMQCNKMCSISLEICAHIHIHSNSALPEIAEM